jgi:CHAD domain-containing protein
VGARRAAGQRETTLTFDVPDDWTVLDLTHLVPAGGSVSTDTDRSETTYFDTAGHHLRGRGLTLGRRTGAVDPGWHLVLPDCSEIRVPVGGRGVPQELRELLLGVRAGAALKPVARRRTDREVHRIIGSDESVLLELRVDDVTATELGEFAVITERREVELLPGDKRLTRKTSKLVEAAGGTPTTKPEHGPTGRAYEDESLIGLVRAYLDSQYEALVAHDLEIRRGREAVHLTRIATRRYRSVLRVLVNVFDADRASALDAELSWYAVMLGGVRDRQVLRDHVTGVLATTEPELVVGPVATRIEQSLTAELHQAQDELDAAMRSRRYFALMRELQEWSCAPPVIRTDKPARTVRRYVDKAERTVAKRLARATRLDEADPDKDVALHSARSAAKRARYIAELSEPALGKAARTSIKRWKKQQERLGELNDGVVAADFFRRLGEAPGENGFTFGILWAQERARGRQHKIG